MALNITGVPLEFQVVVTTEGYESGLKIIEKTNDESNKRILEAAKRQQAEIERIVLGGAKSTADSLVEVWKERTEKYYRHQRMQASKPVSLFNIPTAIKQLLI